MDNGNSEAAVMIALFVGMLVVGHLLSLPKQRWRITQKPMSVTSHRLPFHFGLRTLIIAMTVVAFVLGLTIVMFR
jgi:hypothetical protein